MGLTAPPSFLELRLEWEGQSLKRELPEQLVHYHCDERYRGERQVS